MITCERCAKELSGKQVRWCSQRCSKLGLKRLYKQRNRDKVSQWKKKYATKVLDGEGPIKNPEKYRASECYNCGSTELLQLAHIKPIWAAGIKKYTITLCISCHYRFDMLLKDYWREGLNIRLARKDTDVSGVY